MKLLRQIQPWKLKPTYYFLDQRQANPCKHDQCYKHLHMCTIPSSSRFSSLSLELIAAARWGQSSPTIGSVMFTFHPDTHGPQQPQPTILTNKTMNETAPPHCRCFTPHLPLNKNCLRLTVYIQSC